MPDAYASFEVSFEADLGPLRAGMAQGISWGRVYGTQIGQGIQGGMASVVGGINMLQGIRGQFASVAQGLSDVFGMKASSDIEYYRRQLVGLTGDATKANSILKQITTIANTTSFSNADIFELTTKMIGTGTSPDAAPKQVSQILDATAAMGVRDMATFHRFSRNLIDLKVDPDKANRADVMQAIRASPAMLKLGAEAMGEKDQKVAAQKMMQMGGGELFDLFVKIGEKNQGRAAAEGLVDPFVAAANAAETFANAMAPTGKLVNSVITPILTELGKAGNVFSDLNEIGRGIPGLLLGFGTLRAGFLLHAQYAGGSSLALNGLAVSAGRASLALNALAAGGVGKGLAQGAAAGTALTSGMSLATIFTALATPGGAIKAAVLMAVGAGYGATRIADTERETKEPVKRSALYALRHTLAAIPGPIGAGFSYGNAFNITRGAKMGESTGLEKAADKLDSAASKLNAAADGYGYGGRGRHVMSSIEAGYALLSAERLGVA